QALTILRKNLRPVASADGKLVARLIAELDSNSFAVRKKAAGQLEQLGDLAAPALEKTAHETVSAEVRRRVQDMLEKFHGPVTGPERVRGLRAVEVLELIGTPEARQILQTLAGGAPGSRVTQDAKSSLERLAKRRVDP